MFSSPIAAVVDWVERTVLIEGGADALELEAATRSPENIDPADVPSQLSQQTLLVKSIDNSRSRPSKPKF